MLRQLLSISIATFALAVPLSAGVAFHRTFAPQDGVVAPVERPYRDQLCLNGRWQFQPVAMPKDRGVGAPELTPPVDGAWEKTPIKIPSPWNVNSFSEGDGGDFRSYPSYPKSWESVEMGWLRRSFSVPAGWKGKRVLLDIEAVAGDCRVMVNGKDVGRQFDSFLPLKVDVTDAIRWDGANELLVGVRKPSLFNVQGKYGPYTYPTGSFWGMHIAGIWQDVYLIAVPKAHVADVFVKPLLDSDKLAVDVTVGSAGASGKLSVGCKVYPWISEAGADPLSAPEPKWRLGPSPALTMGSAGVSTASGSSTITLSTSVGGKLSPWTPDSPKLYGAVVEVTRDGKVVDRKYVRFGWRQVAIKGNKVTLNGRRIQLKGDAWHFMGIPQMTRRYAWSWYKMLKDAGGNAIRPHAQVYPSFYLDVADEMGVMVLDETAIWASHCAFNYDQPETWERFGANATNLVLRDRNHPSVFGWSVENEINAALGVSRVTDQYTTFVDDGIGRIAKEMWALDPTRQWISGDGDDDLGGRLPAIVAHYGDTDLYKRLALRDKPYGVGEASAAYYATPAEAARFSGDRAYESVEGRMEGIAIEAYDLIARGQRESASYCSIFNLAWYGLKPLPLGLNDTGGAPALTDGIVFDKYVEGRPGVQPERLGPYSTTLNPGYDPRLPLYEPWPLFDAVKAAYAPGKPAPSKWDHKAQQPDRPMPAPTANAVDRIVFVGANSPLYYNLQTAGAPVTTDRGALGSARMLALDGSASAFSEPTAAADVASVLSRGGTVILWNVTPENLQAANKLLPKPVELTTRKAVSIVRGVESPVTRALSNADLYFADMPSGRQVLDCGIAGSFAKEGKVLLKACDTDWDRWNGRPENIKTGSVLRSELERKPEGAALVEMASGKGQIIVCNVKVNVFSPKHMAFMRKLMAGLDVKLADPKAIEGGVFDALGYLRSALVCGGIGADSYQSALDNDLLGDETTIEPKAGDISSGRPWEQKSADERNILDFSRGAYIGGEHVNAGAYVSFWLYSPRPLDQLLAQPDVPRVDLVAGGDDGVKIWLNGKVIFVDKSVHPLTAEQFSCQSLPLRQGWNHFMVKVAQASGEWQFMARLQCSDPSFMASLKSSLVKPE